MGDAYTPMADHVAVWQKSPQYCNLPPIKQTKKNPPANAGDMGLIPGLRRFHMPQDS